MGYTHHFTRDRILPIRPWRRAVKDCKKVCGASVVPIYFEDDDSSPPVFTEERIRFNGHDREGCETFQFTRIVDCMGASGRSSDWCKTERRPYDLLVTACLLILKHYFPKQLRVSSDDEEGAFTAAKALCQKVLGYGEGMTVTS